MEDEIREFGTKLDKISKDEVERFTQLEASGADVDQ